ncbi:MAG: flagellar basal body L-ring protein FlgH [Alphaproteobacteria bacterium]
MKPFYSLCLTAGVSLLVSGCYKTSRLSDIGDTTPMTRTQDPTAHSDYKPVITPMPGPQRSRTQSPASLWQAGARAFFKDQRAKRVGDILTVLVDIDEKGKIQNTTSFGRTSSQTADLSNLLGYEKQLKGFFPKSFDPTNALNLKSNPDHEGKGTIDRKETVNFNIAALITQVLPNGNLVISGRQEFRFNNLEIREILVTGIVRPEDILSNNTISLEKIAEARLAYGGRGAFTDVSQPPYGQQVLNHLMPF